MQIYQILYNFSQCLKCWPNRSIVFLLFHQLTSGIACFVVQLQEQVVELNGALIKCNEEKMQCQAELALKTAENEQLTNQLQTALQLLEAEKKAREELLKTIMEVKAGAEKVSGEYAFLPFL